MGEPVPNMLEQFDSVRIINLVERTDRRFEIAAQLTRIGAADDPTLSFFAAQRPTDPGGFPSLGARGCFESHLAVVRQALADGVERVLIIEDDFDFALDIDRQGHSVMAALAATPWDVFYGAPILDAVADRGITADGYGLASLSPDLAVMTTSCVGFGRTALSLLEPFLTAMLKRPAGSPDYGPMHVDGAYSVFRQQHPKLRTIVCKPSLGAQRASRSDITPNRFILDRFAFTHPLANRLRRSFGRIRR